MERNEDRKKDYGMTCFHIPLLEVVTIRTIPLHQDPFDIAQNPLLCGQLPLKRLRLVEAVELFQVFKLEQLCTF